MKIRKLLLVLPAVLLTVNITAVMASGKHASGHENAAVSKPGAASKVTRTVNINMKDDMRFYNAMVDVKQGETIRFI